MALRTTVVGSWCKHDEHEDDLARFHRGELSPGEGEKLLDRAAPVAIAEQRDLGLDPPRSARRRQRHRRGPETGGRTATPRGTARESCRARPDRPAPLARVEGPARHDRQGGSPADSQS